MATTTAARYQQLKQSREPFLTTAREAATLSLPFKVPPEGHSASAKLPTPNQSVGAQGTNTLAAKIMMTLLPPNEPFFRLDVEEFTMQEISKNEAARAEVEAAMSMIERTVTTFSEASDIRVGVHEAAHHLIISGNALLHFGTDGSLRVYSLAHFCVVRDPSGNTVEIIAEETVSVSTLPDEIRAMLPEAKQKADNVTDQTCVLYTHITRLDAKKYEVVQSVDDVMIESTRGSYPADLCPWLAIRWNRVDGESYGRSHIEAYLGDLKTLEAITKAITEFAAGAAKVIPLVNPNGQTDERDLAEAENFEFVPGIAADVTFLKIDKYADLQVAKALADDLTRRLEQAFLMNRSIQRSGERVTAEEIRTLAADLEETIGGVYILLAQEMQLPLVKLIMALLTKQKRLPALPKGLISPSITTGLDALSRMHDLTKLDRLVAGLRDLYGPEALSAETNVGDYLKRRAAALGIDATGLIKTPEQKQAEADQRMQMEMMAKLGPNAVNQLGGMAQKGMEAPQ